MSPSRFLTRFISRLAQKHRKKTFTSSFSRVLPPLEISVTIYTNCLPELPPEVWLLIFRFATEYKSTFHPFDFSLPKRFNAVDDGVDDSDHNLSTISFMSFPHSHTHLDMRVRAYFSMMRFKLVLSLVCKRWYKIAQELLFESIWINRPIQAALLARILSSSCVSSPSTSAFASSYPLPESEHDHIDTKGRFIKRLHIETRTMDRCSPEDLRIIIDHAPCLLAYTDYRSVRRSVYQDNNFSLASPSSAKELFNALAHNQSTLRQLSWTNYEDLQFHRHLPQMISRGSIADSLEFLELTFCSSSSEITRNNLFQPQSSSLPPSPSPSRPSLIPASFSIALPHLRSLKLPLDNPTFSVLASWVLPSLQNVCVISADFSSASGQGFCSFFNTHGYKLLQLELGHSSSVISEHILTIPVADDLNHSRAALNSRLKSIRLAEWCPNLVQFICSADAEWNWENPDWIAPHILLPSHPNLEMIGIRDIDKRLKDDMHTPVHTIFENPFFMLLNQIETLLQRESFPRLRFIRDLSYDSDQMRESAISPEVMEFWTHVVDLCRQMSVYVEDFRGRNITKRDVDRAIARKMLRTQIAERQRLLEESYDTPVERAKEFVRLVMPRLLRR